MLEIVIETQPTDSTCGPTCLHAIYEYYGDSIDLQTVIAEVDRVQNGGTLAALLGLHALQRGYRCRIYSYNIYLLDPTWFHPLAIPNAELIAKLQAQHSELESPVLEECSTAQQRFLAEGGEIVMADINADLFKGFFKRKVPLIAGLSATYLYQSAREYENKNGNLEYDDILGVPTGHFVVLRGYDDNSRSVVVADPLKENPKFADNYYRVSISHLITSIMLGVITNDANILVIEPGR